jgi:hypothetical protein
MTDGPVDFWTWLLEVNRSLKMLAGFGRAIKPSTASDHDIFIVIYKNNC